MRLAPFLLATALCAPALAGAQESLPASPPATAPETPPVAAPVTREDHRALLDKFNARIQELEGRLLLAKQKVSALREVAIRGEVAKSRAVVLHKNEMGEAVVLERATYLLDGGVVYAKEDSDGSLDRNKEFEIFNGAIAPGDHDVTVHMVFVGRAVGFSNALKGYRFKVDSHCRFNSEEGKQTRLTVASYAKGEITASTSNQLAVRCDLETGSMSTATPPVPAPTPTK